MREIRTLLLLELRSFFGINKFMHTKDRKAKNRYRLLAAVWIILIIMAFSYVGGFVYGLCSLGMAEIVPAYLTVFASALIAAVGIFTAGQRIFGQNGYDILASMPIKSRSVVISRFLALYAEEVLLSAIIMLPGVMVYGLFEEPDFAFYAASAVATLFIPMIPMVLCTLLGTLIMAVSSRMKNKSVVQSVLLVLLVVGIVVGSVSVGGGANGFTVEMLAELAKNMGAIFQSIYPPAVWLNRAMIQGNMLWLGLFVLVSAAAAVLAVFVAAKCFQAVVWRLRSFTARHNYKIGKMQGRGILSAMCFREAKRYFASSIYVTNTIIGPILGAIMAIALCIVGMDTLENAISDYIDVRSVLPFVFSAVFCMMNTTSTAISMEGRQLWVIKSLPVPVKTWLDSKILLNLFLMLPFYVVAETAFAIALKPSALELLWLIFIPACVILFSVVFGITANLKFHSFDWEREETVVKQSLSATLGGFSGFLVSAVLGIATLFVPHRYADIAKGLECIIMLAAAAILYRRNNAAVMNEL